MSNVFPPFDPEEPRRRGGRVRSPFNRRRQIPVKMIIPNLFTIMGLCAGLTAIRMAVEHRFDVAVAALILAAILDGIDGRIARLLNATSRFGAELDSLADFVDFGVAPAIIIFTWSLQDKGSLGWIVVLVFAICAALRLARFNVALENKNEPDWKQNFFVGVPAPAAALIVLLPLYVASAADWPSLKEYTPLIMIYTVIVAVLMVSRLPTYSGKQLSTRIERDYVLPIFLTAALGIAVLFSYPYASMALLTIGYLCTLPVGSYFYQKQEDAELSAMSSAGAAGSPDDVQSSNGRSHRENTGRGTSKTSDQNHPAN